MEQASDQEKNRKQKRQQMIAGGVDVYPPSTARNKTIGALIGKWAEEKAVVIAGRVKSIRRQGGVTFLDCEDETGKVQIFLQDKKLEDYEKIVSQLDLGDFIEAKGTPFVTKRGEKTIAAEKIKWLAKTLRPIPSSWFGIEDVELRYRHRELDLITDEKSREIFKQRAEILKSIRKYLEGEDFIEVETPILQTLAGGANARPFITKHQALNMDLFLRIAPELYLKRLIAGGLGRVYEVARCFRNEGIDRDHNPEFTQVEFYAAYEDYEWMMKMTEKIITQAAKAANGQAAYRHGENMVEIKTPFPRMKYQEAIKKFTGIDIDLVTDQKEMIKLARDKGADVEQNASRVKVIDELFKTFVRPKIIDPVIIYDYPADMIPLAKKTPDDPNYVQCFQVIMGGTELAKAFSEQNDPVVQREQFETQEKMRAGGDDEAQRVDEEYLQAMEYGMPPTAGCGIGIDRLTAVLLGQHNIKNIILFPTLRPKK